MEAGWLGTMGVIYHYKPRRRNAREAVTKPIKAFLKTSVPEKSLHLCRRESRECVCYDQSENRTGVRRTVCCSRHKVYAGTALLLRRVLLEEVSVRR